MLCTVALAAAAQAGEPGAAAEIAFAAAGGRAPSPGCARAFELLLEGKEEEAFKAFEAAVEKTPQDAYAHFGLGLHLRMRGREQLALEHFLKALGAGHQDPWAELFLDAAVSCLPECLDSKPFLEAARKIEQDEKAAPYLRGRVRHARASELLASGAFAEAKDAFAPLQYLAQWVLVGPFDNRDRAGFETEYEPETEVQMEKPMPGRNRPVTWFRPVATPLDGVVDLTQVFEPNIHVLGYAVTHVKVEKAQWAVLRVGCAGAVKVWLNDREVLQIPEYNEYAPEKSAAPVYLQPGWNQVLVKSAVVEETGWSFSVRISMPEGGPIPGLVVDPAGEALQAYKVENVGRGMPLLEPQDPDLGLAVRLRATLKNRPQDAFVRACYGLQMDVRKLGNKEDEIAVNEFVKAIALRPRCPLFRLWLAQAAADPNQARQAAEACQAEHPGLPQPYALLAELALQGGLEISAEELARAAIGKFGVERTGTCARSLGQALGIRGARAEACRRLKGYVERHPHDADGWLELYALERSQSARHAVLKQALGYCGGDEALRAAWSSQLLAQEQEREAAEVLEAGLAVEPFAMSRRLLAAKGWRQAGDMKRAREVLALGRATAPEHPGLLAALGTEAFREGKLPEAEALWREALRVKPNSPELKDLLEEITRGRGLDRGFFAPYDVALQDLPLPKAADYPRDHAVTLLKQEVVRVNPNGTSNRMVHLVSMLLRPEGLAGMQQHQIYYEPQRQVVDILRAAVIAPDGRERSRASISDRTTSAAMGVQTRMYDEYHLKNITFQDLVPGSIVDLQYTVRDTGDNMYGDYFSDVCYLGDDQPVQRSQYILDTPKAREFQKHCFRLRVDPERLESKDPNREVFKWEAKDLPGVETDQGMPPLLDSLPFVQATTMKTWQEVSTWYWHLAKEQIQADDEMKKTVAKITADAQTPTEKLRAIHDWVIREIRYLGIEFGRNGYKPHRSTETFRALYGDCKDCATLIIAMLKVVNIDSRLVLIRTVDAGKIDEDVLPAPNLFNHCIAFVPDVEGTDYWIDCTTDYHQLGEVPYLDQGAQVLVVGPDGGKFVQIPKGMARENQIEQRITARVDLNGSGSIFVRSVYQGQFAPAFRQLAETPGQLKRYIETDAATRFPGAVMSRFNSATSRAQGPMWVEGEYKVPALASQSGDRKALSSSIDPLNLSTRYAKDAERKHDLELWYPWARSVELVYHLDAALRVAVLPEEAALKESFGTFTRKVTVEGQVVRVRDEFTLLSQRIPKAQYPRFNAFCRKIDSLLSQKILLDGK